MTGPSETRDAAPRLERIVAAVDFTDASIAAVRWVAQAFARGSQIVVLHVVEPPPMPRFLAKRYPPNEKILDNARTGAESRIRSLAENIATGLIWPEVRVGKADEQIVRVVGEHGADLIAVGRTMTHPQGWGRVGLTAQRILRQSHVPVLIVGGPAASAARPPAHVLAAVDDSAMADDVLRWSGFLCGRFSIGGTALHALTTPLFPGASALPGILREPDAPLEVAEVEQQAVGDAQDWLRARLHETSTKDVMQPLVTSTTGPTARAIVDEAERREGAMIVMGSRGAGAADRMLFGSVAEAVLRDAPCPVLVVVPSR